MATSIIQSKQKEVKESGKKTLQGYITAMSGEIKKALPSVITPERFTRMVLSAISTNPVLGQCEPKTFLGSMMNAAQLGLEPNTPLGQAYILPYKNNKKGCYEAQFQIGYKGLIDLAYRSGEVSIIQAREVCENDEFEYEYGLEPKLVHKPATTDRGNVIFYYAVFRTKSDGFNFEVMSREDIEKHAAKYSKSYNSSSSPWKSNFDEMAKKTVLKKLLKYAPLKSDFVRAIAEDNTIKNEIKEDMSEAANIFETDDYEEITEETTVDETTGEVKE